MIQGYYLRVRAAAVQIVYSMDAKSLIQESLFLSTVIEPLHAAWSTGCDYLKIHSKPDNSDMHSEYDS